MIQKHAVVIGSGFGGLALAIRLQASGMQTTLIEKRDKPGGRAYVYQDQGFTFDAGPTVITAPNCLEELFTLAGKRMADYIELMPVSPFYRLYWEDGYRFDYSSDLEATVRQIAAKNAADADGYQRFLRYAAEVFQEGYVKLGHVPFLDFWSMIRVAPELIRLKSYQTVYNVVASFIKDPQLREAFSFHSLLVGGNPFSTSAIYTLIHALEREWGVYFPRGGTGALINAMITLFQELGGEVKLDTPVNAIVTHQGKVTGVATADEEYIPADTVASNADVVHTYRMLLKDEPLADSAAQRLQKRRFSMSLFLIYFGVKREHKQLAHHNVLFGPRYRELLEDIFSKGILAEDFSLYLHAPSVTDPSLAPPGCTGFYVLSPVPHLGKGNIDWSVAGPRYRDTILDYLEQRYIPNLRQDLVTCRIFTPLDFERELNAYQGSAFSLEPILLQSAYFRVHNRDPKIKGLYFVGAGTHPGAGIPGVVGSAKATASLMLNDFGGITNDMAYG